MKQQKWEYIILSTSLITSCILLFVYLNSTFFKWNYFLIGVFQEVFTIPCILIQPMLLIMILKVFSNMKLKIIPRIFFTLTICLTTFILTWGSIFMHLFKR